MMYWVYDISNLQFGLLTVAAFTLFGMLGLLAVRWIVGRSSRHVIADNDIVGFYFPPSSAFTASHSD